MSRDPEEDTEKGEARTGGSEPVAEEALTLQAELGQTLVEAMEACDREGRLAEDDYAQIGHLLDEDLRESIDRKFVQLNGVPMVVEEMINRIFALKDEVRERRAQFESATDPGRRAVLELWYISLIQEKNLLILKTILRVRENLAAFARLRQRMTSI